MLDDVANGYYAKGRPIPFPNHLCLGAKPQAVLTLVPMHLQMHWEDKAKQQRPG